MYPLFPSELLSTNSINSSGLYDRFILFSTRFRLTYLWIFIVLTVSSSIANCAVTYTMMQKNYRLIQKTCVISLALSDLLGTVALGAINIANLAQPPMIWSLGLFLCKFLPMCQMTGILASCVALTFIAMDRYRNVVYALSKRWDPPLHICLGITILIWLGCFGASYKIYTFYDCLQYISVSLCTLRATKEVLKQYYIIMVVIIFCPLFCIFLWFYYSIASIVWKHRKPVSTIFKKSPRQETSSSTSSSGLRNLNFPKTQEDIRVGRKIRTFKIIVTLMAMFILFRLPYFAFQIMKLFDTSLSDSKEIWHLHFSFMALYIVNCFLNPLLYTYLNSTIKIWLKIENFILEVCCFCCSRGEFESFERENPFAIGDVDKKRNSKVRFEDEEKY